MAENATTTSGPRNTPTYTPTMLATFERCPYQYQLKYVRRIRSSEEKVNCGSAAHDVLRQLFDHYRRQQTFPIDWRKRIEAKFSTERYYSELARNADVERVVGWIGSALTSFDGTARILAVERTYEYLYPGARDGAVPAFRLRHSVEVVLRHADDTVEHLDWKTGNGYRIDQIQNTVARIVVGRAFSDSPRILSSTAFLSEEAVRTDELSYEDVKATWDRIKALATAISIENDWSPTSNPLCPWCPAYGHDCPLYPQSSSPDAMTDWLEDGAA